MEKKKQKRYATPSLGINAKSYMWGDDLLDIAKFADEIAVKHHLTVTLNCPIVDIYRISKECPHLIIMAQCVDADLPGGRMGGVLPEQLAAAGADGVIINHASRKMKLADITEVVHRCQDLGLFTTVACDGVEEAKMVASLHPTTVLCEPEGSIGTGITATTEYMDETTKAIHDIDPNIIIGQGGGKRTAYDVYRSIQHGGAGGGGASGIFKTPDPKAAIIEFLAGVLLAREEFGEKVWVEGDE